MVKHLPTMQETQVQSLVQEEPLEKEIATHSSILAWKIPWTEEPGSYSSWGHKESDTIEQLYFHFHTLFYRPCRTALGTMWECFIKMQVLKGDIHWPQPRRLATTGSF